MTAEAKSERSAVDRAGVAEPAGSPPPAMRRNLGTWSALGLSIGLMGISLSANLNPQGAAPVVGRAIPLAFLLATIGVLLVSYGFVRLTQRYNSSGSVFGFVGATLGPRTGTIAGWSLLGTYLIFGTTSGTSAAVFTQSLVKSLGWWEQPAPWFPYAVNVLVIVLAIAVAITPAKRASEVLLIIELVTVALILVVSGVVLYKLLSGTAPHGNEFTWSVFTPQPGTDMSSIFLGAVFGFLAFAGFEAAATLGEEAKEPRRAIPRAILGTVLIGGVFYVVVTAVEVMGFGTDAEGLERFRNSGSLLGDLGTTYIGAYIGDLVTIGTTVAGFAGSLACLVGAARLLRSLVVAATDQPNALTRISRRFGTPIGATFVVGAFAVVITLVFGFVAKAPIMGMWGWLGTTGTLLILVVYVLATIGALKIINSSGGPRIPKWQSIIPILGIAVLGYTIYRNLIPYPTGATAWLPVACAVWILIAVGAAFLMPDTMRRIGRHLGAESGLGGAGSTPTRDVTSSSGSRG
jgi:amino acid transporter